MGIIYERLASNLADQLFWGNATEQVIFKWCILPDFSWHYRSPLNKNQAENKK